MPTFPVLGEELGGYRVEALIGRGGMSVVYLAEQLALGRKVALKLLSPELSEDEEFRQRFIRESRLAGGLEHPNIIPVHEAGDVEGLLFIAMRYVEGSDLKALLQREGALTLERTITLMGQAASALDAAHARGLVHRDVKPGNLLVASGEGPEATEHIYLSDFGLTKKTDSKSRMTSTGQFVGTLDYVAPEQIQGKDVSGRADLYSLACVTFECLTGNQPYERDSEVAVMYAHLQDPPPRPSTQREDLPIALDAVIERALAKNPQERYESCRDFMKALREVVPGAGEVAPAGGRLARPRRRKQASKPAATPPTSTPPPKRSVQSADSDAVTEPTAAPPLPQTVKTSRPGRSNNARIAALIALPIVAAGAFLLTRDDTDPAQNQDPATARENDPSPSTGATAGGGSGRARLPGQLAFLEETAPGSEEFFVSVASPPDAKPREVPGTSGADWRNRRPDWSSSGTFFAFAKPDASNGLNVVLIDTVTNKDVDELDIPGAQGSASVSPDGTQVAFSETVNGNMDIYLWDVASGNVERLTTTEGEDDSPEWSKDGTRIVYEAAGEEGNDIFIMDVDGANRKRVTDTKGINEKLPEFHPVDENLIVYHQQVTGGDFGIYVHKADDTMLDPGVKIFDEPAANEMRPTWSPDGKFIAFDSDTKGNLDVFIVPFDGLGDLPDPDDVTALTKGPHDEQSPAWGVEGQAGT